MTSTFSPTSQIVLLMLARALFPVFTDANVVLNIWTMRMTPDSEKIGFNVIMACALAAGVGFGPILHSAVSLSTNTQTAATRVSASHLYFGFLLVLHGVWFTVVIFPMDMGNLLARQEASNLNGISREHVLASDDVPSKKQRLIWWMAHIYGLERALNVSALEAATVMILEKEFHWNVVSASFAVGFSFLASLPVSFFFRSLQSIIGFTDGHIMVTSSVVGVLSCLFFLPAISDFLHGTEMFILLADCLIFATGYFSNGVIDGLGYKACMRNSFYDTTNYILIQHVCQNMIGRFVGPIWARWAIGSYGRGLYAPLQLVIAVSGLCTVLKASFSITQNEMV